MSKSTDSDIFISYIPLKAYCKMDSVKLNHVLIIIIIIIIIIGVEEFDLSTNDE